MEPRRYIRVEHAPYTHTLEAGTETSKENKAQLRFTKGVAVTVNISALNSVWVLRTTPLSEQLANLLRIQGILKTHGLVV